MAIESIEKLTTQLARLPGIGRKTAQRLAYHILSVQKEQATELADAILAAREKVHPCPVCGAFTDLETCELCSDPKRTDAVLCVVSDARDVLSMEKTREFHGTLSTQCRQLQVGIGGSFWLVQDGGIVNERS